MNSDYKKVLECLKELGCGDNMLKRLESFIEDDELEEGLVLLKMQRKALLDDVHKGEEKISCLDYCVHNLKKISEKN